MIAQFARFAVVGVLGTALDFALLWLLMRWRVWLPLAVSGAYVTATVAQFVANRHWAFRSFERSAIAQGRTYAVVSAVNWGVAVAVVQIGVLVWGLPPLAAKALSIPPSVAVSFFGNRYLTFGRGIRVALDRLRTLTKSS
ncbi:MAG TPA: GtrA family protein [Candidatus Baltobacteraceae bacterium]|nr:GtrA family protein [Candidatus Baltobacteraceae bacterium]